MLPGPETHEEARLCLQSEGWRNEGQTTVTAGAGAGGRGARWWGAEVQGELGPWTAGVS